nr:uncharacterized protein LOC128698435 [Cherax quadricarinatus]
MGLLVRKEVEMSGVVFSVDEMRNTAVDFSVPLYMNEFVLQYRRPKLTSDIAGFVKPYTIEIWVLVLATLLAMFCVIYSIQRAHLTFLCRQEGTRSGMVDSSNQGSGHGEAARLNQLWWSSCEWVIAGLLAQSCSWGARRDMTRVATALWLLTSFVLATVYRSNLTAVLILPKLRLPFDSVEELARTSIPTYLFPGSAIFSAVMVRCLQQRYIHRDVYISQPVHREVYISQDSLTEWFIYLSGQAPSVANKDMQCNTVLHQESKPNTTLYKLRKQMRSYVDIHTAFRNFKRGTEATLMDRHAVLAGINIAYAETKQCVFYMSSERLLGATSLSLAFPKGSTLKPVFDPLVQRLKEFGILDYIFNQGLRYANICLKEEVTSTRGSDKRALDLKDFLGIFLLYSSAYRQERRNMRKSLSMASPVVKII